MQLQAQCNIVVIQRVIVTTVEMCNWSVRSLRAELSQVASYILMQASSFSIRHSRNGSPGKQAGDSSLTTLLLSVTTNAQKISAGMA